MFQNPFEVAEEDVNGFFPQMELIDLQGGDHLRDIYKENSPFYSGLPDIFMNWKKFAAVFSTTDFFQDENCEIQVLVKTYR